MALGLAARNGAICYFFGVLFPLLYLTSVKRSENTFLRFHCFQCLLLFAIGIPGAYNLLHLRQIRSDVWLFIFIILWLACMIAAVRGKRLHAPVIGNVAEWLTSL
jgi:uncharacterized membrane protein